MEQTTRILTRPGRGHSILHFILQLLIPAAILIIIAIGMITGYLEKWLWMGQLHYTAIFWTLFSVQWTMFAVGFVVVFLFIWINLREALGHSGALGDRGALKRLKVVAHTGTDDLADMELSPKLLRSFIIIVSLALAWLAADTFFSQWDAFLRFRYGGAFGVSVLFGVEYWTPIGGQDWVLIDKLQAEQTSSRDHRKTRWLSIVTQPSGAPVRTWRAPGRSPSHQPNVGARELKKFQGWASVMLAMSFGY